MPEKVEYREFCSKPKPFIKEGGAAAGVIRMPEYEVGSKATSKRKVLHAGLITEDERGKHSI